MLGLFGGFCSTSSCNSKQMFLSTETIRVCSDLGSHRQADAQIANCPACNHLHFIHNFHPAFLCSHLALGTPASAFQPHSINYIIDARVKKRHPWKHVGEEWWMTLIMLQLDFLVEILRHLWGTKLTNCQVLLITKLCAGSCPLFSIGVSF